MLNNCTIMGRCVRDPEYRTTGSGTVVVNFTIACDRDFSGGNGKDKETDFIDCTAWRKTAEFIAKYFQKGSMIVVTGSLNINGWTDKEGNKRRSAVVNVQNAYFGESKSKQGQDQAAAPTATTGYGNYGGYGGGFPETMAMANSMMGYPPPVDPGNDFPMLTDSDQKMPWD